MRVLIVVHGFPPTAQGGSEYYAEAQARVLRQRHGAEVLVFTRDADPERDEFDVRTESRDGLTVVRVNNTFRRVRRFADTYRDERIDRIAAATIDGFRPDVAHVHHLTCLSTSIVSELAVRRVPIVLTLHDYWLLCHRGQLIDIDGRLCNGPEPDGCHGCLGPAADAGPGVFAAARAIKAVERSLPMVARALRRAGSATALTAGTSGPSGTGDDEARKRLDHMRAVCGEVTHFLAPSRAILDRFAAFGISPDRLTLMEPGVAAAPFADIVRARAERLRLGFLGSVMMSKAPHLLLEAFARLPSGAASVDIFGGLSAYHGDELYRGVLDPLLAQPDVRWHGALSHDRVAEALATIDVLVVPSIWPEASGLVIKEAFLAGVPVVASRIGGMPEVVTDGVNGLLFEPGSTNDLARTLLRILDEPGLLDALRKGIPPVRTVTDDVEDTWRLYQSLAGDAAAVAPVHARSRRTAAVVLNYGTPDDTFLAVRSLLMGTRPPDEVLVVDNGASSRVGHDAPRGASAADRRSGPTACEAALTGLGEARVVYRPTGRNLGYSGGMNVGIREALARGATGVLIANSDVMLAPDCLDRLGRALASRPDAGIAGPLVLSRSRPHIVASFGLSFAPGTGRMRHREAGTRLSDVQARGASGASSWPVEPVEDVDGVSGCLMLIRREVFDAIGFLDEAYFYALEDLDFCLAARRAGFATLLAPAAVAYHEGSRSIGKTSSQRLYFAARNHLRLADRAAPVARPAAYGRRLSIVALNLAHAVRADGGSMAERIGAVLRGTRDYSTGRFGDPITSR